MSRGVFQVRVSFVKDVQKQEAWWERQHELVAENFGALFSTDSGSNWTCLVILLKELTEVEKREEPKKGRTCILEKALDKA
ncbi:hypothetical protein CFP56_026804 [Quercus suber]|uniref:Uncharacterized protein n=1 Tax=Quercus suber TaxID=58331 RepID=A0AAW0K0G4_QUESU